MTPLALMTGFAVVLFCVAGLGGWLWWRARRALAARCGEIDRMRAALAAMEGYWVWSGPPAPGMVEHEGGTPGPALAGLFALSPPPARFGAILDRLAPDDQESLAEAITSLRWQGKAFRLRVHDAAGGRPFEVSGRRGAEAPGTMADVITFREIGDLVEDRARLEERLEALGRQNTDFRHLFDRLPVPVWVRGADLGILYCNAAYARAVDVPAPSMVVARGVELAGGPVGWGRALAEEALRSGGPATRTAHLVAGRSRRLLEVTEIPIGGPDSHWRVAGFCVDRTDADEARAELARHMESHSQVLESLGTGIVVYDADTRVRFFNTAFARMWDFNPAWLKTGPDHGALLDDLRARRQIADHIDFQAFKQDRFALYTSLMEPFEEILFLPDERVIRMVINQHPLGGLLLTFEDVTDRVALERSYNTLIAVQRETLDNLHEGVAVFGSDARLRLFNPAFANLWRLDPVFLNTGPRAIDVIESVRPLLESGAPNGESWPIYRERLLSGVQDRLVRSGRFERGDGTILDFTAVPLPDGAKLFSYVDVSDSIRVERALVERNEALVASDRLKSQFITNVSYELRTPLNTIIGFTEILSNQYFGTLNRRQAEYARGILEASHALLGLIDDILDLAVLEAGRFQLDLAEVSIRPMLDSVLALSRESARKQGIALELDCPEGVGTILADGRRIKQALFNLVANALSHTPEGGRIRIEARRETDSVIFAISDTGAGIEVIDPQREIGVFGSGNGEKAHGSGLQLGLALVRRYVEHHGGTVGVQSSPGRENAIRFSLPVSGPARPAEGED